MLCLSGFELYSRWVPLKSVDAATQPPFFFVFGPTSLCTNVPSLKNIGARKILFFEGRGRLYTG